MDQRRKAKKRASGKLGRNPSIRYERAVGLASLTAADTCGTVFGPTSSTVSEGLGRKNRRVSRSVKSDYRNDQRCLGLSRVPVCLVACVGVVAVMCWIQRCTVEKAARRKHEATVGTAMASLFITSGLGYALFSIMFRKVEADRIRCSTSRNSQLLLSCAYDPGGCRGCLKPRSI